jgi:hypothetical protein
MNHELLIIFVDAKVAMKVMVYIDGISKNVENKNPF